MKNVMCTSENKDLFRAELYYVYRANLLKASQI